MIKENNLEKPSETEKKLYSYQELIRACDKVEGMIIRTTQKTSLAWLVEEFSKENPIQWQQKIREVRDEIVKRNAMSGKVGVSQFLLRLISEKYSEVLEKEIMLEKDEEARKSLEEMVKLVNFHLNDLKECEEKNEATSFGGVSIEFLPEWISKE